MEPRREATCPANLFSLVRAACVRCRSIALRAVAGAAAAVMLGSCGGGGTDGTGTTATAAAGAFALDESRARAAGVQARFDLNIPSGGPFPSDRFTVPDNSQNTGLRVNLEKSDCTARVSECEDIDVLNELDGFNLQPRLSIPFSGPIDVATVNSETVFLLQPGSGARIGINQVVWDVETYTLHVESDELLHQHTPYVLIVTRGVRDGVGEPVEASGSFQAFRHGKKLGQRDDNPGVTSYRDALLAGLDSAAAAGVDLNKVAVASVFTTQSITAVLEKVRDQIKAATPAAADFILGGPTRTIRTVFRLGDITSISGRGEVRTAPPNDFTNLAIRIALIRTVPETVGTVAFGSYRSPVYLNAERFIPQVGTRTGNPAVHGVDEVFFTLFLPSATAARSRPAGGWPVAIYGPGCCADDNKNGTPFNIAATLADHGVATIAINAAGQGLGPRSTLTVIAGGQTVTFPAGGRSIDINGDGAIGPGEGTDTPRPRRILFNRDPRVQTIADLIQLVRVIEAGVDVDGDIQADLDPSRIYYFGNSAGAIRGMAFVAVEPNVRATALAVPGGVLSERIRLSPGGNRAELGELLAERVPPLLNSPGVVNLDGVPASVPHFSENMPLRDGIGLNVRLADGTSQTVASPVVSTVPGAMDIQRMLENMEWANMPADAVAFAPYLRKTPLSGLVSRSVIILFARGDQTVPNPATTALVRAGDLADRTTYYRTDHAVDTYGAGPGAPPPTPPPGVETNGHNFLVRMNSPLRTAIAVAAQRQVAVFLQTDGTMVIDPNEGLVLSPPPDAPLFETPIQGPLPEDLGFIL